MFARIKKFIQEVKVELERISWATREELWGSTMVVIVSVIFLALFIGLCDFILSHAIHGLMRL